MGHVTFSSQFWAVWAESSPPAEYEPVEHELANPQGAGGLIRTQIRQKKSRNGDAVRP